MALIILNKLENRGSLVRRSLSFPMNRYISATWVYVSVCTCIDVRIEMQTDIHPYIRTRMHTHMAYVHANTDMLYHLIRTSRYLSQSPLLLAQKRIVVIHAMFHKMVLLSFQTTYISNFTWSKPCFVCFNHNKAFGGPSPVDSKWISEM